MPIPNIELIRKKTNRPNLPGRKYIITKNGSFDFGLYEEIISFIESQGWKYSQTKEFKERQNCGYAFKTVFDGLELKHRDYGLEAVSNALTHGCGTIVSATGSGKSFLTASLIENIKMIHPSDGFKCFVLVPGLSLVNQLVGDFDEYGVTFTYSGWTGEMALQDSEVVICNTENFCSKFSDNNWIKNVDLFITDEVHKVKSGNVVTKHISKINTPHKYGFTGTLPKDKVDEWKIIGTFGPIIFEKKSKDLREQGFLSNAVIKCVKLNYSLPWKMNYREELEFIYSDEKRNQLIQKLSEKLTKNSLILVNHLIHGENLLQILSEIPNKKVYFVHGGMPVDERDAITDEMETTDDIICIAMSSIFSTGINIKNLHYIMFVAGGKSFIRTIQAIGRGLRLHDNKNRLTLFDIYDNLKYSLQHSEERKVFYDEEQIEWNEKEISI